MTLQLLISPYSKANESRYQEDLSRVKKVDKSKRTQLKDTFDNSIYISEVSFKRATELFEFIKNKDYIPFTYPEDGCYARAHIMSRLLETKGIISGKAFVHGRLGVYSKNAAKGLVVWNYHVATFLLVKKKGHISQIYVLDPSIFNKPVTFNQWQNIQIESLKGTYKTRAYITSRFHLFPIKKLSLYNALNYYQKKSLRKYKVYDFLLTTRTFLNFWELKKEQVSLVDMLESMKKDM